MSVIGPRMRFMALAILAPLSVLVPWMLLDHTLPVSDASLHLGTAYKIWATWQTQGPTAGLSAVYNLREFKPVLYVAFGALGMALTGGRALWSLFLCNLSFYVLFLSYLFLIFEMVLGRRGKCPGHGVDRASSLARIQCALFRI